MKWLAVLFSLFILGVIASADLGLLAGQLAWVHALPLGDKIAHFLLIGLLSFLISISLIQGLPARDPVRIALVAAIVLALLFGLEEASQGLIRGRDANLGDLTANYAGIALFSWLSVMVNKKQKGTQPELRP